MSTDYWLKIQLLLFNTDTLGKHKHTKQRMFSESSLTYGGKGGPLPTSVPYWVVHKDTCLFLSISKALGCSSGALLRSPATVVLIDQSLWCKNFSSSSPCLPIFKSSPLHVTVCANTDLNVYILLCMSRVIVLFSCIFSLASAFLRVYSTFCLSFCFLM